jgi:hypothetical protein
MPDTKRPPGTTLDLVQAAELTWLVELEARWENLRHGRERARQPQTPKDDLREIQKAYDAFRSKLNAYNKLYEPVHVPELLLNTPARLGKWCRAMNEIYACVENDPQGPCPTALMKKAYRYADQVALKLGTEPCPPPSAPADIQGTIHYLNALSQWCDQQVAAPPVK